jgi:hypothetical protein
MAANGVDTTFFGLFGLAAPATLDQRRVIFLELVSLFDSLHDFGEFGSVYDYVTRSTANVYTTHKRTIFNHLRNSYPNLVLSPAISLTNSKLQCAQANFYLRASLSKSTIEEAFYNYARDRLVIGQAALASKYSTLTVNNLRTQFNIPAAQNNIVFSIDTQKKLTMFTNRIAEVNFFQTLDMEKVCDPASHTTGVDANIGILIEDAGHARTYEVANGVNGVERAILTNFNNVAFTARIQIDLPSEAGVQVPVTLNAGGAHVNSKPNINRRLNRLITATPANLAGNQNVVTDNNFYNDAGIINYGNLNGANPPPAALRTYIRDIRRRLAQKRLGDQLQVLACLRPILYRRPLTTYEVTNPIFVSIDRMAIAFAIANGVNCIYSNGDNLTLIGGQLAPTITNGAAVVAAGLPRSLKSSSRKPKQRGGVRTDWEMVTTDLVSSPQQIVILFTYISYGEALFRIGKNDRRAFGEFLGCANYTSTKINDQNNNNFITDADDHLNAEYKIRSCELPGANGLLIHNPVTDGVDEVHLRNYIFYGKGRLKGGVGGYAGDYLQWVVGDNGQEDRWTIQKNVLAANTEFTLRSHAAANIRTYPLNLTALTGMIAGVPDDHLQYESFFVRGLQRGGAKTKNREFLQVLAQYDMCMLADDEQMKIWFDEFYTMDDGFPFFKPTFYELNALFQTLFQETYKNFDFMFLLPYLQQSSSNAYANSCLIILKQIFTYMEIEVEEYSKEVDESAKLTLDSILETSSNLSTSYAQMIEKLEGMELFINLYEKDLTPLYFLNKYLELYQPTNSSAFKMSHEILMTPEMKKSPDHQTIPQTEHNYSPNLSHISQPSSDNLALFRKLQLQQNKEKIPIPVVNQSVFQGIESSRKARRTKRRTHRKINRTTRKIRKTRKINRRRN